jgi:hypothetical protein
MDALALLFNSIARIMQGAFSKNISGWSRGFLIGVGLLSLGVSDLVIAHPFGVPLFYYYIDRNCFIVCGTYSGIAVLSTITNMIV